MKLLSSAHSIPSLGTTLRQSRQCDRRHRDRLCERSAARDERPGSAHGAGTRAEPHGVLGPQCGSWDRNRTQPADVILRISVANARYGHINGKNERPYTELVPCAAHRA
jgi:hypothetical protein